MRNAMQSVKAMRKCEGPLCVGVFDLQRCRPGGGYPIGEAIQQILLLVLSKEKTGRSIANYAGVWTQVFGCLVII